MKSYVHPPYLWRLYTGLIASLSPAARRQMAADIAKKLRASQQQRIRRQQAPDGTPY
ncbi:phage virion morphogenesis protein, partial [Salmonella enterica subsp. enterica serovar Montevideo]|nr:phage virion morphogenesis protein [Salmonella enterica subsp. enterica serovar Montevideo]